MTNQEAIRILTEFKGFCDADKNAEDIEAFNMAITALEEQEREKWHSVSPYNPETYYQNVPNDDRLILVSFNNAPTVDIARFRWDVSGGAFCPGDEDYTYSRSGIFVNAWRELPESYTDTEGNG